MDVTLSDLLVVVWGLFVLWLLLRPREGSPQDPDRWWEPGMDDSDGGD